MMWSHLNTFATNASKHLLHFHYTASIPPRQSMASSCPLATASSPPSKYFCPQSCLISRPQRDEDIAVTEVSFWGIYFGFDFCYYLCILSTGFFGYCLNPCLCSLFHSIRYLWNMEEYSTPKMETKKANHWGWALALQLGSDPWKIP